MLLLANIVTPKDFPDCCFVAVTEAIAERETANQILAWSLQGNPSFDGHEFEQNGMAGVEWVDGVNHIDV